jgi:ribulose 1,5-bisphosphate synthetase/thiazole synthase
VKIAENATILGKLNLQPRVREDFLEMSRKAREVYTQAVESLLAVDENKADVVIIGGGVNGCSLAYNLVKRDVNVVVFEKII